MFSFVGKILFFLMLFVILLPPKALCQNAANNIDSTCFNSNSNTSIAKRLDRLFHHKKLSATQTKVFSNILRDGMCVTCSVAMKYLFAKVKLFNFPVSLTSLRWAKRQMFIKTLKAYCYIILLPVISVRVCHGLIDLNIDFLIYAVENNKKLNPSKACSIIAQKFECFRKSRTEWSIDIPPKSSNISKQLVFSDKQDNFYRVLHLTDFHADPFYKENGSINCRETLCCQSDQRVSSWDKIKNNVAGKWGHYKKCDQPYYALENLFQQVTDHNKRLDPKFSYVYFTGDIISHRYWDTTKQYNTDQIKKVYRMFKQYFKSIPIYPILGNHETSPVNVFSPPQFQNTTLSTTWIFDLVAKEWANFLPAETLKTVLKGGFYTVLVKPGFRIVALNSNVCYVYNWWLLYNPIDPYDQLKWLVEVLLVAEENGEFVHILSHIPPGDSECLQEWSTQFRKIVERFSHIITGQFNGHTHFDEFRVFYDSSETKAINVAFNGGSFSIFSDVNPNYRFYDIQSETHEVLDYEEWTYDLTEANKNQNSSPRWYKLYKFREAYNVPSLKPEDIGQLVQRMKGNRCLLEKYYRFKVRNAEPSMLKKCKSNILNQMCEIKSTEAYQAAKCQPLTMETVISTIL